MTLILFFVGYFGGLFVGSFILLQALICIFFGIPTVNKLTYLGVFISPNPIVRNYAISATILSFVFVTISVVVYLFMPEALLTGYVAGIVFTLFFGLGQIKENKNNLSDLMETNARYLNKKDSESDLNTFE